MCLNLREQQLKIITHTYMNHTVTTNKQSAMDMHTKKRKKFKHNTKDSHQNAREESKRGRKEPQKQPPNNEENGNKYISISNYFKCKWTKHSSQKT